MALSYCVTFNRVAASRPKALPMVSRGEAILALLFRVEGILPSNRGQDARDTQGRDALATRRSIGKLRLPLPPVDSSVERQSA
jgi:hypothetical protein